MPTNLPAEYYNAEELYKAASTPEERIRLLEELISTVPKHKGTDHLRADLRRRLSKLKSSAQSQKKVSRHVSAYQIEKEGAGQVAIVGSPNVGKSALLEALTNASPEVADYPFTTWTPSPGMMDVGGAQIQLIDTPPLSDTYIEPALMDLVRRSDLIILVVDLQADPIGQLQDSLKLLESHRIAPERHRHHFDGQERFTFKPTFIIVNKCDGKVPNPMGFIIERSAFVLYVESSTSLLCKVSCDHFTSVIVNGNVKVICHPVANIVLIERPFAHLNPLYCCVFYM